MAHRRTRHRARLSPESGIGLAEVLVAITVLALATTIALVLYDESRRSFKVGENRSEQQQGIRIAYDELVSDLRLAGFNHNPDGNRNRPDEQIEGAFAAAAVVRADFDAQDSTAARQPEADLEDGAFQAVSTGNDEIRIYVLAKPGAPDSLTFFADVAQSVRDGSVDEVRLDEVALAQDDPPYTLYRITLDNDAGAYGGAGFFVRTPLVENVRTLRFRYYDGRGAEVLPPGGADDAVSQAARASIRRIGIDIEGMTRDPDPRWVDPSDANPSTQTHRKFGLEGDVTPPNLGRFGLRDIEANMTPPSPPARPLLVRGHCAGLYVAWTPNPPQDEVALYRLFYGTDPSDPLAPIEIRDTGLYLDDLSDAVRYWVWLVAVDDSGYASPPSMTADAVIRNLNTPRTPLGLVASSDLNGRVVLTWNAVTENAGSTPGDPRSPLVRDLANYRIFRGTSEDFPLDPPSRIADSVPVEPSPQFVDRTAVNCRPYYYRVQAVDECLHADPPSRDYAKSDPSAVVPGSAQATALPEAPVQVQAFFGFSDTVRIRWDPVREDADGEPIYIEDYKIYTTGSRANGLPPPEVPDDFHPLIVVSGFEYFDHAISLGAGQTIYYVVTALDACINESAYSEATQPICSFPGQVVIEWPEFGDTVSGSETVDVKVVGGTPPYAQLSLTFRRLGTVLSNTVVLPGPGPDWSYDWDVSPPPYGEGLYRVTATVDWLAGSETCSQVTSIEVQVTAGGN